ncbi:uroplakin-2 [Bufo gargarizans]|uniref:uroplakin-2 n=1 Tax=Bufo gargarizans TaxID=30331 RepID=UPI001CF40523|nr:uroplakin-2 [Bufo gargarizans]
MQLLIFPALLLLISTSNGYNTSITNGTFNPLVYSAIIDLPPCNFSNQIATVKIQNDSIDITKNFTVPQCRIKRDLIVVSDSTNGNVATVNVGYQIINLSKDTDYTVWYEIGGEPFSNVTFKTQPCSFHPFGEEQSCQNSSLEHSYIGVQDHRLAAVAQKQRHACAQVVFVYDIPDVFRRSGGMVVITVLLSIAMFLLVGGLIAVVVLGGRGSK